MPHICDPHTFSIGQCHSRCCFLFLESSIFQSQVDGLRSFTPLSLQVELTCGCTAALVRFHLLLFCNTPMSWPLKAVIQGPGVFTGQILDSQTCFLEIARDSAPLRDPLIIPSASHSRQLHNVANILRGKQAMCLKLLKSLITSFLKDHQSQLCMFL